MTCGELIEFLMAYDDGELAPDRRDAFDAHLARCAPCLRYLATYREAVALGRDAFADPAAPVPGEVPEELVQAILAVRAGARA
jgi:anti-sigma factor RsiW